MYDENYSLAFAAHHGGEGMVSKAGINPRSGDRSVTTRQFAAQVSAIQNRIRSKTKPVGNIPKSFTFAPGTLPNAEENAEIPAVPSGMDNILGATSEGQRDARWSGQIAMDVTFRDSRGNVVQKRNGLTVSEPRLSGTGGNRFTWNDDVTIPG
jgi:hypothetical protein